MAQNTPAQQVQQWVKAAQAGSAADMANLYTENAVLCATEGIIQSRANIEADFAAQLKAGWKLSDITNEVDNVQAGQNWGWSYGNWSGSFPNPQPPPATVSVQGSWSVVWVFQNGTWLMQQQTIVTNPLQSQGAKS